MNELLLRLRFLESFPASEILPGDLAGHPGRGKRLGTPGGTSIPPARFRARHEFMRPAKDNYFQRAAGWEHRDPGRGEGRETTFLPLSPPFSAVMPCGCAPPPPEVPRTTLL
jgi:hypothetical protein